MPEFLGEADCAALRTEIRGMRDSGALQPAAVGRGRERQLQPTIRTDLIHWIDESTLSAPQRTAWERLDELRVGLNRRVFLGLTQLEAHLSAYPPGNGYRKHVDNFRGSTRRFVSCVLYLNADWREEHGGRLRIYERDDQAVVACGVDPVSGTLACFLSADIAHEVLPTTHERLSVTGWFSVAGCSVAGR